MMIVVMADIVTTAEVVEIAEAVAAVVTDAEAAVVETEEVVAEAAGIKPPSPLKAPLTPKGGVKKKDKDIKFEITRKIIQDVTTEKNEAQERTERPHT
jgi:hypothetical protein